MNGEPRTVGKGELTLRVQSADDGTVVLTMYGALDLASVDLLQEELSGASDAAAVVIDLEEVTFIDSSGLHMLVRAARRSVDGGPAIRLRRASVPVRHILDVAQDPHALKEFLPLT